MLLCIVFVMDEDFILFVVLSWFLLLWAEITHCEGAPEKENHVSKKLVRTYF